MGEAAAASPCLMRSISHPLFASCEFKEGDPLRALTTSVSFGRFMTEPLNWEKWSSFSHNRILEDVKKYSRPGAVAEKKAFFEAHYKNFAAKKAANSPQKENQVPNYPPPLPYTTANINPIAISKAYSSNDDTQENELAMLIDGPHIDESMPSSIGVESEIASNEDVGSSSTNLDLSEISNDDNISSTGQVEEEITLFENKKIHIKDAADSDKLSRLAKPEISLLNSSSEYEEYKKLESPPKELAPEIVPKKTVTDVMERKRSALQSLHLSMNFSPARNKNGTSKTLSKHKATKVSENEVKKSSQVLPKPESKRSKPVIGCSTNGSRKVALKSLSTKYHLVAPNACTKKPKPTTVPSTFSFKCDERAAKRKEKLEQKCKVNETQTIQLQPKLKDKTRSENNRLRCSTALEAKASTSETKAQSNNTQKVPPKTGRKPTQDTCFRSPWKSSSKPKNFIEINKKKLSSFMACLPAKKMQDSIG
uniref:protein WVD2-like 7 isoform X2 n=1 Tax=Erigeron canadensis TaxID=72917 RepID=UPI001CB91017|nr:protein WVD2-like 7 isoform X2 [Erigeron canadensis]